MTDQEKFDKHEPIPLSQVVKRYGFTRVFLRELVNKGRLKAKKQGGRWMTTWADVEAYLASRVRRGRYKEIDLD